MSLGITTDMKWKIEGMVSVKQFIHDVWGQRCLVKFTGARDPLIDTLVLSLPLETHGEVFYEIVDQSTDIGIEDYYVARSKRFKVTIEELADDEE